MTKKVNGFKGFDKDFKCQGYQFEVGKTYKHDGDIKICSSGFHFCKNPMDVFSYYPLIGSNFAEVEADGKMDEEKDKDSKVCSESIRIKAKIDLKAFIGVAVKGLFEFVKNKTTGYSAHSATTGDSAHSATTGDYAHSATTGYSAHSATTGNSAHSATTGYSAHSATTGGYAHSATTGNSAIACALGHKAQAKSVNGNWLVLSEYDNIGKLLHVKTALVDGKKIKADVWYMLKKGKFVAINQ